jgi:hypothetical protein
MALLDLLPLNLKIGDHLFLLCELVLHEGPKRLCLPFEPPLKLPEAFFVFDIERFPEQVGNKGVHEARLILDVGGERPELPVNVHHLIVN